MLAGPFDLGIDLDVWPWVWLGIAVVFALVELTLVGGSFIILPWAASAFVASILAFYDAPIEAQWLTFLFGGAALFFLLYRWAKRFMREGAPTPGVGAERLVGLTAIVTAGIQPDDVARLGRVQIGGEEWGAISDAGELLPVGARVRILAVTGTRVVVELIETQPKAKET
jgi:membrane protein implicated in regulation of membrane protease activity